MTKKTGKTIAIVAGSALGIYVVYRLIQSMTASNVAALKQQQLASSASKPAATTTGTAALFAPLAPIGLANTDPNAGGQISVGGLHMSQGALINPATVNSSFVGVQDRL